MGIREIRQLLEEIVAGTNLTDARLRKVVEQELIDIQERRKEERESAERVIRKKKKKKAAKDVQK